MNLKKQGTIQQKLAHKPSFKNILNIEQARLPSRSNEKKVAKSRSQKKVSSIINKSPKKILLRPSQLSYEASEQQLERNNQNKQHNTMPYQSEFKSEDKSIKNMRQKYEDVNSQISRSNKSRSPKKDNNRENMRQIVLIKNKSLEIQRILQNLQSQSEMKSVISEPKNKKNKTISHINTQNDVQYEKKAVQRIKNLAKQLDIHLLELRQTEKLKQQQYFTKIDQMSIQTNQFDNQITNLASKAQTKNRIQPGMRDLQSKLQLLQKMFN